MNKRSVVAGLIGSLLCQFVLASERELSTVDRRAISERIAAYAYRWDRKDVVGFSELFAVDGAMDWVYRDRVEETRIVGRANVLAYARDAQAERIGDKQSRHHFTNLVFLGLAGDRPITEHMVFVTHQAEDQKPEIVTTGYYRIEWSKTGDEWFIQRRTLYLDR